MLIDWFTVAAQIVNFLILVVLLKWLLYDRIVRAMDRREQDIASRFDQAEKKTQEARESEEYYQRKNRELEEQWEELTGEMKRKAEEERKRMADRARKEVDELRGRWLQSLRDEQQDFAREFAAMSAERVFSVSKRSLKDLAGADLEERAVEVFLSRLSEMPKDERAQLARSLKQDGGPAVVRTAFELSSGVRRKTTKTLHDALDTDVEVAYETDPDLIMGIELQSAGRKAAWSAEEYMAGLEAHARDFLEQRLRRDETGGGEEASKEKGREASESPSETQETEE